MTSSARARRPCPSIRGLDPGRRGSCAGRAAAGHRSAAAEHPEDPRGPPRARPAADARAEHVLHLPGEGLVGGLGAGGARRRRAGARPRARLLGPGGVAGDARLEQLGGALAVEALRVRGRRGDAAIAAARSSDVQRASCARPAGRGAWRRPASARRGVEHGHRGLADAERLERLGEVVVLGRSGKVSTADFSARASFGVNARTACCTRCPSCGQHLVGDVGGQLGDEEDADALRADRAARSGPPRRGRRRRRRRTAGAPRRRRTPATGFSGSPTSGSARTARPGTHIRKVEKSAGCWATSTRSSTDTIPRPSGAVRSRSVTSNAGSPKKTSPPSASSWETLRSSTPAVAVEMPAERLQLGLAGAGEVGERRAQVLQVDQRRGPSRRRSGRPGRGSTPGSR